VWVFALNPGKAESIVAGTLSPGFSMQPFVIDNFLSPEAYDEVRRLAAAAPVVYGAKSNSVTDPHGHWSWKPLHDNRKNLFDLSAALQTQCAPLYLVYQRLTTQLQNEGLGARWALIRAYVNVHTYGIDGYFHQDSEDVSHVTAILYLCDAWHRDWAGETVISSWEEGIDRAVLPRPNRLFVIPSALMHAARAVSRKCNVARPTLVLKLRPLQDAALENLSIWLEARGALALKHGEGTLHSHLLRVALALAARKAPPHVVFGGGLHSIYGTNAFKHQLVKTDPSNRAMVSNTFGERAESLAYLFSVIDRPATLEKPAPAVNGHLLKLNYDHRMEVGQELLHDLQLIECANLADQKALGPWPQLRKLWEIA